MPRKTRSHLHAIALITAAASGIAGAQELAEPVPIDRTGPDRLVNAADRPVEGWAIVRYSVLADGTTDNVHVAGVAPPAADPSATVEAVEQWTFEPGTSDGSAIDWHNNESVVVFDLPADTAATSPEFEAAYNEIVGLVTDENAAGAESTAEEALEAYEEARDAALVLLNEHATGAGEIGVALSQAAIINAALSDAHTAYDFVRLATDPGIESLAGSDLLVALQLRLQLEIQLGRTSDALSTYERIAAADGANGNDVQSEQLAAAAEELRARRQQQEVLTVLGHVDDRAWRMDADRRTFTIANIEGEVSSIDAECDTRRLTLDYQPDVEWRLPDSLGDCTLFVDGDSGTTFSFYELLPAEG